MSDRWLGVLAASSYVVLVDAEVPDTGPITLVADHTWKLQAGNRPEAYKVMHQHVSDYVRENKIKRVVIRPAPSAWGQRRWLISKLLSFAE